MCDEKVTKAIESVERDIKRVYESNISEGTPEERRKRDVEILRKCVSDMTGIHPDDIEITDTSNL